MHLIVNLLGFFCRLNCVFCIIYQAKGIFVVKIMLLLCVGGFKMSIVNNRKAFHDYFIEEKYEAGLVLEGWEVKAIRAGRVQIKESYVIFRNGAFHLLNAHISPLPTASTHIVPIATRTRKLLLKQNEINKLIGKVERAGYTLVAIDLHFVRGRIKLEIGLAKGKKQHDKRQSEKEKDWAREKQQMMKHKMKD